MIVVVVGGDRWEEVVGELAVGGREVGVRPQAESGLG